MFSLDTHLLVVEDMKSIRSILVTQLGLLGFKNITECDSGQAAFQLLKSAQYPIELVISDIEMPQGNGIDLLKLVRGDRQLKHLPFVIVSIVSKKELMLEAIRNGATGYIMKPFNPPSLATQLGAAWKRHQEIIAP